VRYYLPTHRFEPHDESDQYCGHPAPDFDGGCVRPPEHPIHALDRGDVESLARALAFRKWKDVAGDWSVHARHKMSSDCAICTQDLHAIAAAVLEIQAGGR
jgi:hypothetical protein